MELLTIIGFLLLSYIIGSIPFGYLFVKWFTGQDVTSIQSGRTGGTNAGRAAGLGVGLLTAVIDFLKSAVCVWIAKSFFPENFLVHALAPVFAILGHNYSIFLIHRNQEGKIRLGGGAGGAACVGGSFGLWAPSLIIILPLAALVFYFIGYASVTTASVAFLSIIVFSIRWLSGSPVEYILFGIISLILLLWALRPNIKRLIQGNERLHGFRAKRQKSE